MTDGQRRRGERQLPERGLITVALLALVLTVSVWTMTQGIESPLLGPHSFRQTQTAISAYYMAEDPGMFLSYITPVLGKPWAIPMEVPVFQWVVARWTNLTGMPLDESGRLASIVFWLACAVPLWSILRSLGFSRAAIALSLALVFSNAFYLYWGRAFLIESLALFLALCMVAMALRGFLGKLWPWLVGALLVGCLAALVKVTTWAVAAGTGLLIFLCLVWQARKTLWKRGLVCALAILLPVVPAKMWLAAADNTKAQNVFARELLISSSPHQKAWNYGTIEQKLSPATWQQMRVYLDTQILPWIPGTAVVAVSLILLAGIVCDPRRAWVTLVFLAGFAAGPIVFTNLYFEHNYYWFANAVWLLLAVGAALSSIHERLRTLRPTLQWAVPLLVLLGAGAGFASWNSIYWTAIKSFPKREEIESNWTAHIERHVPKDHALLILGNDWNPIALYYAGRKGLAFPLGPRFPFPGSQLDQALHDLHGELGGVVVTPQMLQSAGEGFWVDFLTREGMSTNGIQTAFGILFPSVRK